MPLLAVPQAVTPSQRETLRRYGSLEVAGVRRIRTWQATKAHQHRKQAQNGPPSPDVLRAMGGGLQRL